MSYSIGDGLVSLALAAGILGYLYMKHQARQTRMEVIHQERMAAMDKGIPLPEFPFEPEKQNRSGEHLVIPLLGLVLTSLSLGTMVALYMNASSAANGFWISPLPFAFLGVGFLAFHFMPIAPRR